MIDLSGCGKACGLAGAEPETILPRVSNLRAVERRSSGTSALYCTLPLLSIQRKISPVLAAFCVAVVVLAALTLGVAVSVLVGFLVSVGMKLENGLGSEAAADAGTAA